MKIEKHAGLLIARTLIVLSLLAAGFQKMSYLPGTAAYLERVGVPGASVELALAAALVELAGALAILVGYRARLAAQILIVYLLPAVWFTRLAVAHASLDPVIQDQETFMALKNLSIIGGLLLVLIAGPGEAFDRWQVRPGAGRWRPRIWREPRLYFLWPRSAGARRSFWETCAR